MPNEFRVIYSVDGRRIKCQVLAIGMSGVFSADFDNITEIQRQVERAFANSGGLDAVHVELRKLQLKTKNGITSIHYGAIIN